MPRRDRWRPTICRRCKASADEGVQISTRGLCEDCATLAVTEAVTEMMTKSGPRYDKWRERIVSGALGD